MVEQCQSGREIHDVVASYGETHGFPTNRPYSTAMDVLLHSADYWYGDGAKLKRGSWICAADAAGAMFGGLAGAGLGFIAGGPVGATVGGIAGGGIIGGGASIALNEAMPGGD